ncbi:MAG: hypothetical protein Q9214_005249, partial [Letrouitia sp. 1 TL-2023]
MFQRLKGAIDSRIAEEQARQRSALNSTLADHTPGRSSSRGESPSKQTPRNAARTKRSGDLLAKGPDPSDFEPEFVIDDSNAPSRSGTPRPPQERSESSTKVETEEDAAGDVTQGTSGRDKSASGEISSTPPEIPTEVRVKLRKLEKLESRYNELLRSYRLAHSRVSTIDNFEATLRENTPLTSISDPGALVEYLNQLNLKGDMVVDELKRVSSDRDNLKQKLSEAERSAREAWDEVTNLRKPKEDMGTVSAKKRLDTSQNSQASRDNSVDEDLPVVQAKSPPASATSRTGSITSFSIFSPKTKPLSSPIVKEENEDLFSYDNELPRLEEELRSREEMIDELHME